MPNYWLKMVGATEDPLANNWIETNPELLREVRTPRRPTGIKRDDILVYYAAGAQKLFAIVRATDHGEDAQDTPKAGQERWPWVLRVQARLVIPTVAQGPHWGALEIPSASIQQQSYIEISTAQYTKAWEAIIDRTRPSSLELRGLRPQAEQGHWRPDRPAGGGSRQQRYVGLRAQAIDN